MIAAIILTAPGTTGSTRGASSVWSSVFTGVAFLVGLDIHFDDLTAVGLVMLVAVGYAVGPIIINRRLADLPPIGVVTASLIVATVLYAPFTAFSWPVTMTADAAWSIAGSA